MSQVLELLPARLESLVLRPYGKDGRYVAKNMATGTYFELGVEEYFLLSRLDGQQTAESLSQVFADEFGEPLSEADVQDFLELARSRGLLETGESSHGRKKTKQRRPKGNILYCRFSLFDPDRLFNWLEPKLRFCWSTPFMVLSSLGILAAAIMVWANRHDLVSAFKQGMRWETLVLVWITIVISTFMHEFAHGLTCKRHGGEVHEVGVLLLFFTPCFFCNVSDAWLIPEKSKRLWVTLAGAYCDLCIWAFAAFVWRITAQDTLINFLAWAIVSVCGIRLIFNLNPFMKMDGYYLASDWLEIPNLRRRAKQRWMSYVRWLLWGAPWPEPESRGTLLTCFGGFTWFSTFLFLDITFIGLCKWLSARWGLVGVGGALFLFLLVLKRVFRGFVGDEFAKMLATRRVRTAVWLAVLLVVPGLLVVCQVDDRTGGPFQIRTGARAELRAPVAGFLREVRYDEGNQVTAGEMIVRLEVPDLESSIQKKQAELSESLAQLRKLQAGARPEQLAEVQQQVARATAWRDLGTKDLQRARQSLAQELRQLDEHVRQCTSTFEFATTSYRQAEDLYRKGALTGQQLLAEKQQYTLAHSQLEQARAAKLQREAAGTLQSEAELALRDKALADSKAALALLLAGSRPEDIEAEKARSKRLTEELKFLTDQQQKCIVSSGVAGVITTGRLREKIGQYFELGALICVVEDLSDMEAEVGLAEEEAAGVEAGQLAELKTRALPLHIFHAKVERVAPAAVKATGAAQSKLIAYCRLDNDGLLRSGMTGVGRIYIGKQSLAAVLSKRLLRYLRSEFWW